MHDLDGVTLAKSPRTSTIPTGSRLLPPSRSARAAPASTTIVPRLGFE